MDIVNEILKYCELLSLKNANEAETRKKIIDKVLEGFLGWNDNDISYEERVSEDGLTTFADYIIRTADISILIEAKRVGVVFGSLPDKRKVKISGAFLQGDTGLAITQAREYCRKKSIPFAVVTNGLQWILFPAVRVDGVPFSDSSAIVFNSIEDALGESSNYFKSLLSRDGVIEGNLTLELIGRRTDQYEERRLNKFFKGGISKRENPIFSLIENEVLTAFSDSIVESNIEVLEKCYVKNADRVKFDNRIKMHLQRREPLFSVQPKKPMRKKESGTLVASINSVSANRRPLAILILGTVGTGKTTFLQYTRRVASKDFFHVRDSGYYPHWIDVDFRGFSKNESPIDFIYSKIFDYICVDPYFSNYEKSIKFSYEKEISALKKGPLFLMMKSEDDFNKRVSDLIMSDYNEKKPYVDKQLKFAAKNCPVFIVIDNVDQFESDDIQSEIFSDAIAVASRANINLIMAMRESTYVKHRGSAVFDAFDFDPLHVEPPEILSVLSRRFFLTSQLLSGKRGDFVALNGASFQVDDLSIFIDILKSSVLGTEIGERIDVLSNHDVRLALRMTREFISRGYTDPAKAISAHETEKRYTLPKQEAFRSILLGNQSVYSEEYSVIGNPFDSRLGRSNGEMLRLFALSALVNQASINSVGYIDAPDIKNIFQNIGFSESDTLRVLNDLCSMRFVHTKSNGKSVFSSSYASTRLGGHIMRNLLGDFTFIENVMMDTFISDKDTWEELRRLSTSIQEERDVVSRVILRVKKVKTFYSYITNQYTLLVDEAKRRNIDQIWLSNPLSEMRATLDGNMEKAIESARRNYG